MTMGNAEKLLLKSEGVRFPNHLPFPAVYEAGTINGFWIHFRNYYFVLNGKFPAVAAREIFDTVSQTLDIRADGHGGNISPESCLTSDEFEEKSGELVSRWLAKKEPAYPVFEQEMEAYRAKLMAEDISKFFVRTYHIDTIEGMVHMARYIKEHRIITEW